jgi:NHL repeat
VGNVGSSRVDKFTADGSWVAAWGEGVVSGTPGTYEICTQAGGCQPSSYTGIGGAFNTPLAVATDSLGNVYVAGDDRITKLGADGHFIAVWGKDVDKGGGTGYEICTVSANCKGASSGGLGGEFYGADGIGIDATDHVYVADYSNNRIQKFDSNGNFERAWGKNVIQSGKLGDAGTGFEVCTTAADCQAGSSLADLGNKLGGTMDSPFGTLGFDTSGNVYVGDLTSRVQKFGADGHFIAAWGKDVIQSGKPGDTGTGYEICTAIADCQAGSFGTLGGELNQQGGGNIAADADGAVYVADWNNDRIQRFADSSPPPGGRETTSTTLPETTTTTTTLPAGSACAELAGLAQAQCLIEAAVSGPLCADPVPGSLVHRLDAKLGSADTLLGRASAANGAKRRRLVKKARASLGAVSRKAAAAGRAKSAKKRITPACAASIQMLVSEVEADLR